MAKQANTFTHKGCGSEMAAQEKWLRGYLSDPYDQAEVVCDHCMEVFPASEFVWSKSGKTFAETSRRLRAEMPAGENVLRSAAGSFMGVMGGTFVGSILACGGVVKGPPGAAIFAGLVVGGAVGWYFLNPLIYRALWNAGVVSWKGKL